MRPEMIFAVHCRGGKGRTGTMICSWLLWSGHCTRAADALDLFQRRRTDEKIRGKWQGVETASQRRYVHYVERLLASGKSVIRQPRRLRRLVLRNIFPEGVEVSEALLPWVVISQYGPLGKTSLDTQAKAGSGARCVSQVGTDLVVDLEDGEYCVGADVKVELYCDKSAGVAMLDMEPRLPASEGMINRKFDNDRQGPTSLQGLPGAMSPTPGVSPGRSSVWKVASLKADSMKILSSSPGEPGPPIPGADRQLVLYAWMHMQFELDERDDANVADGESLTFGVVPAAAGSDSAPSRTWVLTFEASRLDQGHGLKPLFKKLKKRHVNLEMTFDAEPAGAAQLHMVRESESGAAVAPAAAATVGSVAPVAAVDNAFAPKLTGMRSAALERAKAANSCKLSTESSKHSIKRAEVTSIVPEVSPSYTSDDDDEAVTLEESRRHDEPNDGEDEDEESASPGLYPGSGAAASNRR